MSLKQTRGTTSLWVLAALIAAPLLLAAPRAEACTDFSSGRQGHLFVKGLQAFKHDEFSKAAEFFREASTKSDIDLIYLNLGFSLAGAGRCQQAWEAYSRVLDSPNICGAPTKEDVAADLKYAVEELGSACPSFVEVDCDGAQEISIRRLPGSGELAQWMKASPKREGISCEDEAPILLWPGLYEVEATGASGSDTAQRETFSLLAGEYKRVEMGRSAELVVTCDKEADLSLNGTAYRRCYERATLRLPPGIYDLSGTADDAPTTTQRVHLTKGETTHIALGSNGLFKPDTVLWEFPLEASLLALSGGLSDGLLRLRDKPGSGDLLRLGFGPRFFWNRLSLSPRLTGAYGRFRGNLQQLDATVSARTMSAGLDLDLGVDLLGPGVLSLRAGLGLAAVFVSVSDVTSTEVPPVGAEPSGTGLRGTASLRACTAGFVCVGALVGTDSQISIDATDPGDPRSAPLDSTWIMAQVSVDLIGVLRDDYFP